MAESNDTSIDTSLLKVPFESLKRRSRERKHVIDSLEGLAKSIREAAEKPSTNDDRIHALHELKQQVQNLLSEAEDIADEEARDAQRCKVRLQHLRDLGPTPKDSVLDWNRKRMSRVLVDHLLRSGHSQTAAMLTQAANIEDLTDGHVFRLAVPIAEDLRRHDCRTAIGWCIANRVRLRKAKSKLEFRLRLQEFIELVRAGERLKAIRHSQQHLAPWAEQHFGELQRAVTSLVFGARTTCLAYKELFSEARWEALIQLFYQELFRLHSMTQQSLLALQLQAGLSALKPPPGSSEHKSKEDPLHHKGLETLASDLPYAKHVHSQLVCSITKEVMDEHNAPVVLPNGTVYSEKAIDSGTQNGQFTDPISGEVFERHQLRRAYIS